MKTNGWFSGRNCCVLISSHGNMVFRLKRVFNSMGFIKISRFIIRLGLLKLLRAKNGVRKQIKYLNRPKVLNIASNVRQSNWSLQSCGWWTILDSVAKPEVECRETLLSLLRMKEVSLFEELSVQSFNDSLMVSDPS